MNVIYCRQQSIPLRSGKLNVTMIIKCNLARTPFNNNSCMINQNTLLIFILWNVYSLKLWFRVSIFSNHFYIFYSNDISPPKHISNAIRNSTIFIEVGNVIQLPTSEKQMSIYWTIVTRYIIIYAACCDLLCTSTVMCNMLLKHICRSSDHMIFNKHDLSLQQVINARSKPSFLKSCDT